MTAPTSAMALPNPASTTVTRLNRASHNSVMAVAPLPRAERAQLFIVAAVKVLDDLARQGCDDGCDEHRLGDDHGLGGVEKTPVAQGPCPRQQKIDGKAGNHGWQAHEGVHHSDEGAAPREPRDGRRRADRQADQHGEEHRKETDPKRHEDDLGQIAVKGHDQAKGFREGVACVLHGDGSQGGSVRQGLSGWVTCNRGVVGAPGFEPGVTGPKPVALPLGHAPAGFL